MVVGTVSSVATHMSAEAQAAHDIALHVHAMSTHHALTTQETTLEPQEWDILILGGGTAGCVLANRLSANGKWRVLVIEAGESSLGVLLSQLPGGYGRLCHRKEVDYDYFSVPQRECHGRKMYQPRMSQLWECLRV
jgi:heterodisulfide reductase subunit A-like polyferredoxin